MRSNVFTSTVSVMIVCSMLFSAVLTADNAVSSGAPAADSLDIGDIITDADLLADSFDYDEKIQPGLLEKAKLSDFVKVFVITNDVATLAASLKDVDYRGNIGTKAPEVKNIATPLLQVPGYMVDDIAALPGVMRIIEYEVPDKHSSEMPATFDFSDTANAFGLPAQAHWADRVWDMGYNGTGINVAIIDSGVDFAHPELFGSQARVPAAPASPYSGWPIAFDSASMDAYVGAKGKAEKYSGLWYADTSSTDPNIIHDITIDGKNDFWRIELVAQDPLNNGENAELPILANGSLEYYNDYELQELYAQQNYTHWFFGFNTFANNTDVIYTLYIDSDGKFNSGATSDPLGNYVNATGWSGGVRNPANATHMPEYAVTVERLAFDDEGNADKLGLAQLHTWDNSSKTWSSADLVDDLDGMVGYSGYKYTTTKTGKGYMEFSIPKQHIGNDDNVSFILFSAGAGHTHAFDTVYSDPNASLTVADPNSTAVTSLTAFTTMGWGYFEHFYNIDEWGPKKNSFPTTFQFPAAWAALSPVHFGYHPDDNLPLTGICVIASATAGVYDTVYVDLDNNLDFSNDKPMTKGDEVSYFDSYNAQTKVYDYTSYHAGDGFADLSGGMIYYISDGINPVPYLDEYLIRYHLINNTADPARAKYIEGNGNMTAFTGELDLGEIHGTECASSVVGKGRTYVVDSNTLEVTEERHVLGMAPGASIITVANAYSGNLFDCWLFAAEGYDGNVSTFGDQPQIAAISFGFGSMYNDGWDTYSKYLDWIIREYSQGGVTFTASSGDAGPGYGSVTSPASASSVICVGASSDYSSRDPNGLENGPNPTWGDAVGFSGRGPTVLGEVKPDVLAVGRQAFGALPLNYMTAKDGSIANEIWMGTSISSSASAGVLALVYQAYAASHGGAYPSSEAAKEFLMSGADDMNYDVLQQGTGMVNAYRSVKMALEQQGISSDVPKWVPGDYNGASYEVFAKLMLPGASDTVDINLDNHGSTAVNANIHDGVLKKYAQYEFADTTAYPYNPQSPISYYNDVWFYISNPGKVASKPHGVYSMDGSYRYVAGDEDAWNQAELLKVTARANETDMDPNGDGAYDYSYWLDMYDWTDIDGNGEMKVSGWTEMNRLNADSPGACTIVLHVRDPAKRLHSGLGLGVRLFGDGNANITWTVTVEMYKTVDWSWLTTSASGLVSIPANGLGLTATVNVPSDAKPGSYDGAIYVESLMPRTETVATNPIISQTNVVLENTTSVKTDNLTVATTPTTAVTNTAVLNTTLHPVPLTAITNTAATKVSNESLVTTVSTAADDWIATLEMSDVAGEIVANSGPSVPVTNEYLGLITDPAQTAATLLQGQDPYLVVSGSMSVYKNTTLFPDSVVQVTDEPVATGYTNDQKLALANGNVDPESLVLRAGAVVLVAGVNYDFDWLTGEITVLNLNAGAGVNIFATYRHHTGYRQHEGVLYFTQPIGYMVHLSASYSIYDYSSFSAPMLAREGFTSDVIFPGSVTLYINGAPIAETADYVLDYGTGQITLLDTYGPVQSLTADYSHYSPEGTDFSLSYGRDISQEDDTGGYFLPQFVRQQIVPEKKNLLGFEVLMHENPTTGGLVKVHLIKSEFFDRPYPTPDEEVFTVMATSQKTLAEVKEGWNIFNFPSPVTLSLGSDLKYYMGIENANYQIARSAANAHAGSLYLSPSNTDGKWTGATWVSQAFDMAFRTYNGYIAPGSVSVRKNSSPFADQIVTKTDQVIWSVAAEQVFGEEVTQFEFVPDDGMIPDHWVIETANHYTAADPVYITDVEVFANGIPLQADVDYLTLASPMIFYLGYDYPLEMETGKMWLMGDYTSDHVAVTYKYHRPLFTLGSDPYVTTPDEDENLPMQIPDRLLTSCTVMRNSVALTEGSDYTLDWATGELLLSHTMSDKYVHNQTLYTSAAGDTNQIYLQLESNILDYNLYADWGGAWTLLTDWTEYWFDDQAAGLLTYDASSYPLAAGDAIYACYNYTDYETLELGDVVTVTYSYHEKYTLDMDTGDLTFTKNPVGGENFTASYRYYLPFNEAIQVHAGTVWAASQGTLPTNIMAGQYIVYIDGKVLPQAGNYALDTVTGKLMLLKPLLANNTYTITYKWYYAVTNFNLPPIGGSPTDQTQIVPGSYSIYRDGVLMTEGPDYSLIADAGKVNLVTQLNPNVYITASYTWYRFVQTVQLPRGSLSSDPTSRIVPASYVFRNQLGNLAEGVDFTFDTTTGLLTFPAPLSSGNLIWANYTWYNTVASYQLPHSHITTVYLWNGATPYMAFTLNQDTGVITFSPSLGPNANIKATYWYYIPPESQVYELDNKNLVAGSWQVSLNGALLVQDVDYTINPAGTATQNATIVLASPVIADKVLTMNYSYYVPITSAKLPFPGISTVSLSVGATALVQGTDYSVDMYRGTIEFLRPIPAGSTVTANYQHVWTTTIPVLVNVPAMGSSFSVGGPNPYTNDLFNASAFGGGYGNGDGSGDWRFFYTYIPEQGLFNQDDNKFLVDFRWEGQLTDVNLHVFGKEDLQTNPATSTQFSDDVYGPYTLARKGGSDKTPAFYTTTGGPSEVIALPLTSGLNVIAMQNVKMNGSHVSESFTGEIGTLSVSATELEITTNQPTGSVDMSFMSSMELNGLGGQAAGPSAPSVTYNMTVKQDDPNWANYATFQAQLASGSTTIPLELKDCLILEVRINGHVNHGYKDVTDLDLGLFLDGSNGQPLDGITQVEEFCAMDADGDADETIRLIKPDDGHYLIRPFGFTLKADPAHYDLYITTVQGKGFTISGMLTESIAPYTVSTLQVSWILPGDATEGTLLGAMFIGPSHAQTALLIPITLNYDVSAPLLVSFSPTAGSTVADRNPQIAVSFSDLDKGQLEPQDMEIYIDGESVTHRASLSGEYDRKEAGLEVYGIWTADIGYKPMTPLAEGGHTVKAIASDTAGNKRIVEWGFTIDVSAPLLEITYPAADTLHIDTAAVSLTGKTSPSATLSVLGMVPDSVTMQDDGSFEIQLSLLPGVNDVTVKATDLIGNSCEVRRFIVLDETSPVFSGLRFSTGYVTNSQFTTLVGELSEQGTLSVNGVAGDVNGDGTFERVITLTEGRNTIHLEFTDLAGNVAHSWQNVTLDTVAPTIVLTEPASTVKSSSYVLSGTVESDVELFINGNRINVNTTRQDTGSFSKTLTLSEGYNTIVIEARDDAGNVVELRHIVEYDTSGTNYGAIGLMVALLILGLVLGLFIAPWFVKGKEQADEEKEPLEGEKEPWEDEGPEAAEVSEIPGGAAPAEPDADGTPEAAIPAEETAPEEIPAEPEKISEGSVPEAEETEEIKPEPEHGPEPATQEEDPRIAKLTEAYKSGKISKELYEKNLARFKAQK